MLRKLWWLLKLGAKREWKRLGEVDVEKEKSKNGPSN
jgi:hypothetical protein